MTKTLAQELHDLLDRIEQHPVDRHLLQPELHRLLARMKAAGEEVPERLREFDQKLVEEGVEAQFDNLPL